MRMTGEQILDPVVTLQKLCRKILPQSYRISSTIWKWVSQRLTVEIRAAETAGLHPAVMEPIMKERVEIMAGAKVIRMRQADLVRPTMLRTVETAEVVETDLIREDFWRTQR